MGMKGKVYLIGVGPGSPDLITVRGHRVLAVADVIILDYLLPDSFLEDSGIPMSGKVMIHLSPDDHDQEKINRLLIESAAAGKIVARLKGGDALVFGRGAEEATALSSAGIAWEIIPGLTSGIAAPALADLALVSRGGGRSFAIATGRCAGGKVNPQLPRADSLVLYMGVQALEELVTSLIADGWNADTPAILIENASLPWEREATGTLGTIAREAAAVGIAPPALFLVGEVARKRIAGERPTILFTGLDPTNFRGLGRLLHWPALRVEHNQASREVLSLSLERLTEGRFTDIVLTSRVGVSSFFEALFASGHDARSLNGTTITTAGAGTAQRLREYGLVADRIPEDSGGAGILSTFAGKDFARVLLVQGTHAPSGLEEGLIERGAEVTRLALHRVISHPELGRALPKHDIVYFVSPSGVRAYSDAYGASAFQCPIWTIGEVTRRQVEALGYTSEVVSPWMTTITENT